MMKEERRYTCLASRDDCPVHKGLNMIMPNIAFSFCRLVDYVMLMGDYAPGL